MKVVKTVMDVIWIIVLVGLTMHYENLGNGFWMSFWMAFWRLFLIGFVVAIITTIYFAVTDSYKEPFDEEGGFRVDSTKN